MYNFDSTTQLNLSTLIDAMPAAIFIVNHKNRIMGLNKYATQLAGTKPTNTLRRMCGDVLHCMHALNSPKACGTMDYCKDCEVNNTIKESCAGHTIVKRKAELLIEKDKKKHKRIFLISASPYVNDGKQLTILSLEDISELTLLRSLLPICATCKKIRDDKGYWSQMESYFEEHSDTSFSHGICPECSDKLYGDQNWYKQMKADRVKSHLVAKND